MENKLSAVEWLEDSFRMNFNKIFVDTDFGLISNLIKQAKEMEKEQILRAYRSGEVGEIYELNPVKTLTAKQYYENNYGK
jgi:hypothetical protein